MFDVDDLLEKNVVSTETEDPGERKVSSLAECDYSNVDKWVAGRKVDTSERLIIPGFDTWIISNNNRTCQRSESIVTKHKGDRDGRTGKKFTSISWPPTNKLRSIPIPQRFPDGCLSNFVMWAIDSESSEAWINCGDHEYGILDKNNLLRFGEHDIKNLAMHQIKIDPVFEVHCKDFTSLAASIVRTKLWAGSKVMQTLPTKP
ncbi:hypothetical protein R6Q59_002976 [Mikania micrantha]